MELRFALLTEVFHRVCVRVVWHPNARPMLPYLTIIALYEDTVWTERRIATFGSASLLCSLFHEGTAWVDFATTDASRHVIITIFFLDVFYRQHRLNLGLFLAASCASWRWE